MTILPHLLPPCLLLLAGACTLAAPTLTADVLPQGESVIHVGDEKWLCGRVVDGITGEPIAGAELLLINESDNPMRGEFWWAMRAMGDADGFVRIRADAAAPGYQPWDWALVRAPGYAAAVDMGCLAGEGGIVPLAPAETLPVLIRDWADRPVAGALVGFCSGCGHTPDLVHARTDENGLALLRGVDPQASIRDLYIEHPELALGYKAIPWYPGEPAAVWHVDPAFAATGKLVDQAGEPVAGAYVGYPDVHRGPWTRTASDGTFGLCGTDPTCDLFVHHDGRKLIFAQSIEHPLQLQLPVSDGESTQVVELPEGAPFPVQKPIVPAEAPTVQVQVEHDDYCDVYLSTARGDVTITDDLDEPIAIPDQPFAFVLRDGRQGRVFRFTRAEALAASPIRLPWFAPTRVEGRVVGPDGQPRTALLDVVDCSWRIRSEQIEEPAQELIEVNGAFTIPTNRDRLSLLVVRDAAGDYRRRVIAIMLPERGDEAQLDVGTIVLGAPPQLTIRTAGGEEAVTGDVEFFRRGWQRLTSGGLTFPLNEDGVFLGPDARAGDAIRVRGGRADDEASRDLDVRFVLAGDGPWQLRLPAGEMRLDVRDETGESIPAYVTIGDQSFDIRSPVSLRRLRPGQHRIFVAADGRQSAIVEVTVPTTTHAAVKVQLPPR